MPSIEWYVEHADELAEKVVNAWELKTQADKAAPLSNDFKLLFDKACQYRSAKSAADSRRQFVDLKAIDEVEEKATRQAFAEAYKNYSEKSERGASANS
jgi:hypothetical protein